MPFWQRLAITIAIMLVVSFLAGLLWQHILGFDLPSYGAGIIGGLTALPMWEFLKRIKRKKGQA